ncbi:MAG: aminopeptidase P N-terminal domain-containing protein, partial [Myxococcota bacterium]|nr:aminopeptidase P N-terminal domain-containing protein [Myxococcota bacterium]
SDLYYLTGFTEPESLVFLVKSETEQRFEMVVRPRDPERETWDGRRAGVAGAMERFGADAAHPTPELTEALKKVTEGHDVLLYALGEHPQMDENILTLMKTYRAATRRGISGPTVIQDPGAIVHEMRLLKDTLGKERMQTACDISVEAHNAAMRATSPGMTERQIQAVLEGTFRIMGSARNGYPCIVAGGENATILHYNENDQVLEDGGLLLIDAGAEYDYYSADITRTFPINGRFSPAQREVYEVVLRAQLASVDAVRVGNTFHDIHDISVRVLTEGLVELGLIEGDVDTLIKDGGYQRYYMHKTGHWLGMDVHDVGAYFQGGESRPLAPGMVLTVEPGLYIAPDDETAPERFRGIGIRIEDDVMVTDGDPAVLTAGCPKSVEEIEALMATPAPAFPSVSQPA